VALLAEYQLFVNDESADGQDGKKSVFPFLLVQFSAINRSKIYVTH
jgi:hypothetical protein